ncbi:MAG: hypothetical protein V1875_02875 [Candidatus Altiarchaeota archaeon]
MAGVVFEKSPSEGGLLKDLSSMFAMLAAFLLLFCSILFGVFGDRPLETGITYSLASIFVFSFISLAAVSDIYDLKLGRFGMNNVVLSFVSGIMFLVSAKVAGPLASGILFSLTFVFYFAWNSLSFSARNRRVASFAKKYRLAVKDGGVFGMSSVRGSVGGRMFKGSFNPKNRLAYAGSYHSSVYEVEIGTRAYKGAAFAVYRSMTPIGAGENMLSSMAGYGEGFGEGSLKLVAGLNPIWLRYNQVGVPAAIEAKKESLISCMGLAGLLRISLKDGVLKAEVRADMAESLPQIAYWLGEIAKAADGIASSDNMVPSEETKSIILPKTLKSLIYGAAVIMLGIFAVFFLFFGCMLAFFGFNVIDSLGDRPNPTGAFECESKWLFTESNECFMELAFRQKDPSLCARMSPVESSSLRKDTRLGERGYMIGRTYCYFWLAKDTDNPELCKRIVGKRSQELCVAEVARSRKDPSLCKGMEYLNVRGWCLDASTGKLPLKDRPPMFLD